MIPMGLVDRSGGVGSWEGIYRWVSGRVWLFTRYIDLDRVSLLLVQRYTCKWCRSLMVGDDY
jgi:hypothetical protein